MHLILSAIIVLLGIIDMVIGIGFFVNPSVAAGDFGLSIASTHGESTLRGDMTAFFCVAAVSMALGGWKRRADWLVPALGLFGIAFTGRLINLIVSGPYDQWFLPMGVEALHCILIIIAMRVWPWSKAPA